MANSFDIDSLDVSEPAAQVVLMQAIAAEQSQRAFARLFQHFAPRLQAYCQRLGCRPEIADELVQEAMSRLWRKAGQFNAEKAAVSTWLYTIARNLHIDHVRREKRPAPDPTDPAMEPTPQATPMENLSRARDADRLRRAVGTLNAEQREVLELAFFQEKSHSLIAQELDLPLGTVKSRIRLALKHVRAIVGDDR